MQKYCLPLHFYFHIEVIELGGILDATDYFET